MHCIYVRKHSQHAQGLTPSPGHESAEAAQFASFVPHIFLQYTKAIRCTHAHTHTHVCLQIHTFVASSQLICLACLGSTYVGNNSSTDDMYK